LEILKSKIDASVNYVDWVPEGGAFESRFVQRTPEYFITYLSSHTGCNKACRMCHLTQTGQTMMQAATIADYVEQADRVLAHYATQQPAQRVNYNFMARGEPMANPSVIHDWAALRDALQARADHHGIGLAKFNLSTIMPTETREVDLVKEFSEPNTHLYYSLYSMNPRFRKRWLPKAIEPELALDKLAAWQHATGRIVTLHWAFIEGENDDMQTLDDIISAVHSRGLVTKLNAVRYNPYSDKQGREPSLDILNRNFQYLNEALGSAKSRIVPRVGHDVAASCGMFPSAA
jgi:23S rRNA (adenine2503-C2)-methyltransferase